MEEALRVRVSGPLADHVSGFVELLTELGFSPKTRVEHARRLSLLSRWLERDAVELSAVDEALVVRLVEEYRRAGHSHFVTAASFGRILGYLRSIGAMPAVVLSTPETAVEVMLEDYRRYLRIERGLRPATIGIYLWNARLFMSLACGDDTTMVHALTARDVAGFVTALAQRQRPSSVNTTVVGVRALLRWFYATGMIDKPLAQATPWLARGAASTLPRTVAPGAAELLLGCFDRTTLVGTRDFAIVTMFARLGLRVGEVVEMQIGDVDWRRGELEVRSKGGWRDPLPVPVDVGDALAAYLTMRGRDRGLAEVFWCARPPRRPITATAVRAVIRRACARVGLPDLATHRLRHSVARDLLRDGASLPEIGQVLRHHNLATTAIYAKVDHATLAAVTQPWPGSES